MPAAFLSFSCLVKLIAKNSAVVWNRDEVYRTQQIIEALSALQLLWLKKAVDYSGCNNQRSQTGCIVVSFSMQVIHVTLLSLHLHYTNSPHSDMTMFLTSGNFQRV